MGFNSLALAKILTEIFKDINLVDTIAALDSLHEKSKGFEVETYLESYFSKIDKFSYEGIYKDATYIGKLFPHCSKEEIVDRLKVLGNEENRVRIVLRELVKNCFNGNTKGALPNGTEVVVSTKKVCTVGDLGLYNKPTTSKDCSVNMPCTSESVLLEENDIFGDGSVGEEEEDSIQNCFNFMRQHLTDYCDSTQDLEVAGEEEVKKIFTDILDGGKAKDATFEVPNSATEYPDNIKVPSHDPRPPIPKLRISIKALGKSTKDLLDKTVSDVSSNSFADSTSVPNVEPDMPKIQEASNGVIRKVKPVVKTERFALQSTCRPITKPSKLQPCGIYATPYPSMFLNDFWLPKSTLVPPTAPPITPPIPPPIQPPPAAKFEDHTQDDLDIDLILRETARHLRAQDMIPKRMKKFTDKNRYKHPSTCVSRYQNEKYRPIQISNFLRDDHQPPVPLPVFHKKVEMLPVSYHTLYNVKRKRSSTMEDGPSKRVDNFGWREPLSDSDTDSIDDMYVDAVQDVAGNLPTPPYHKKTASQLMEMFPDACPNYIKRLCVHAGGAPVNVDLLVDKIISDPDYPKREEQVKSPVKEMDTDEQFKMLKELFPNADPNFLYHRVELYGNNKEKLQEFIESTFEKHDYPTIKEHLRKQQLSAQTRQYTQDFKIEEFLKVIPDPETYFNDPERKSSLIDSDVNGIYEQRLYALQVLKNLYSIVQVRSITTAFSENNYNVVQTANYLDAKCRSSYGLMRTKRKTVCTDNFAIQNIPLLQEIAYIQHRQEIAVFLQNKHKKDLEEKELARQHNLFCTCGCCFDDEVMPNAVAKCEVGCVFCKECIQKSVEVLFGEGKLDFPCLSNCESHFSLQTLQAVLTPKLFSKMVQKKQLQEIKAAGIEDLESCPFCDFATIPAPGDKIFHCMNPECMKESCRLCKEPSHVPLRCDEVEKDDDIKRRTYIENKMTEALLRKCLKCGLSFIKSDGCNKMTCSCGAMMCYVCGKGVDDYKHFNGQGGDRFDLCPLYSDTNKLHQESVLKGAELAKAEVGVNTDPSKLKIDPTVDLEKHYKEQEMRNPQVLPPGVIIGPNIVNIADGIMRVAYNRPRHAEHNRRRHHHHGEHQHRGSF